MLKKNNLKYFYLISIILLNSTTALDFNKVVIWGHKLHTHTHSYIHFAYYKTFQHLGYKTYWFDDNDNVSNFDFSKSLFITEGQVDRKIPMRQDCYYILHHCDKNRYSDLNKNQRAISMYVFYTTEFHKYPTKIDNYVYGDFDLGKICMPWATDLLPHEIELNKQKIKNI